jgi:hypothetical protein
LISPRSPRHGFSASTTERHAVGRNMGRMGRRRSSCAYGQANKLSRTCAVLLDALNRHRGRCDDRRTISGRPQPPWPYSDGRGTASWHRRPNVTPLGAIWHPWDIGGPGTLVAGRQDQASGHLLRAAVSAELTGEGRGSYAPRHSIQDALVTMVGHKGILTYAWSPWRATRAF